MPAVLFNFCDGGKREKDCISCCMGATEKQGNKKQIEYVVTETFNGNKTLTEILARLIMAEINRNN